MTSQENYSQRLQRLEAWTETLGTTNCWICGGSWDLEGAYLGFLPTVSGASKIEGTVLKQLGGLKPNKLGEFAGQLRMFAGSLRAFVSTARLQPLVKITCSNCGNVLLLDAVRVGVVDAPSEDE